LRAYIIHRTDSENIKSKIASTLPRDIETVSLTNSYEALENIRLYGKPCLVFIQSSKIANNGIDYLSELKNTTPYTYVIVICEDTNGHKKSYSKFPTICDSDLCGDSTESTALFLNNAVRKVNAICLLKDSVGDIQNDVKKMKERTKLWATKFTMNS
jgi:hypothetical protein